MSNKKATLAGNFEGAPFEFHMTWDGINPPNFEVKNGRFINCPDACHAVSVLKAVAQKLLEEAKRYDDKGTATTVVEGKYE